MIYRRGKAYWYNFRWTITNPDGTKESFRIVKSARAKTTPRMLKMSTGGRCALGRFILRDPWPQTAASAPARFSGVRKGIPAICKNAHEARNGTRSTRDA